MSQEGDADTMSPDELAHPDEDRPSGKRRRASRARQRILRSTAVLPSLFTISNGLAGFGAIHFASKDVATYAGRLENLAVAAWLIFAAMICDMLDGRLARMTRRTSDFGGQLDSLCDMISFGVAPAMMMLRAVVGALRQIGAFPHGQAIERTVWCVAAVYVACAALRLARFNVENEPDESAHMDFKGLPSPGAAAAVAALVLLLARLNQADRAGWLTSSWLAMSPHWLTQFWPLVVASIVLPLVTLAVGLLMVSQFKYAHLVNHYVRGKRPFSYLVKLVMVALVALLEPFVTLAVVTVGYATSGLISAAVGKLRPSRPADS